MIKNIRVKTRTETGKREINEDSFLAKKASVNGEATGLFAAADGVGGLDEGEQASRIAVEMLEKWWFETYPSCYENPVASLNSMIQEIDSAIREYGDEKGIRLATTLSAVLIHRSQAIIFHIGDSKIFYIDKQGENSRMMSMDHTKQIKGSGKKALVSCLGNARKQLYTIHLGLQKLLPGDRIYIGTDGIFKEMGDKILFDLNLKDATKTLFDEAEKRGESDNLTLIQLDLI